MKPRSPTEPVSLFSGQAQARRLRQVTEHQPRRLKLFQRVYAKQTSPREGIKAFCLECHGFEEAAIRDCSAPACPLYWFRPYQRTYRPTANGQ